MLESMRNLKGVTPLSRTEQKIVKGGANCVLESSITFHGQFGSVTTSGYTCTNPDGSTYPLTIDHYY